MLPIKGELRASSLNNFDKITNTNPYLYGFNSDQIPIYLAKLFEDDCMIGYENRPIDKIAIYGDNDVSKLKQSSSDTLSTRNSYGCKNRKKILPKFISRRPSTHLFRILDPSHNKLRECNIDSGFKYNKQKKGFVDKEFVHKEFIDNVLKKDNRSGSIDSSDSKKSDYNSCKKKVKKIYPYVDEGMNIDDHTQKPSNGKGASSLIWSHRRVQGMDGRFTGERTLCVLLGLEKHGKYADKFNIFGGHYEEGIDDSLHDTVLRELSEEFGTAIHKWVSWYGSPWAFNQSYIEIGSVSSNFNISKAFRENDEIKEAKWFPIDNILNSRYDRENKKYLVKDLREKEFEITIYAYGVLKAVDKNGQIR